MSVYIVYTYNRFYTGAPKMVIGCYINKEEAKDRLKTYGQDPYLYSSGVYYTKNGYVSFINEYPLGECNIEIFTTLLES